MEQKFSGQEIINILNYYLDYRRFQYGESIKSHTVQQFVDFIGAFKTGWTTEELTPFIRSRYPF